MSTELCIKLNKNENNIKKHLARLSVFNYLSNCFALHSGHVPYTSNR